MCHHKNINIDVDEVAQITFTIMSVYKYFVINK